MSRYDDLFDDVAREDSVFADKGALDPLVEPDEIVAREAQERDFATILQGVHDGYLPTTVSIYGPPGTGKTVITRQLATAFAERTPNLAVEYVNLKECRSIFSAANEILFALTGAKKGAWEGLDGAFEAIWTALEEFPEWIVLILDEIDHVQHDANYDPNDFFYRLLRGEGKLERGLNLSVWLISNELVDVDLRLDSRVQSAMGGEGVFFPPYNAEELDAILGERLERAFDSGCVTDEAVDRGVREAADRWGDARKALRLFRQAGDLADERELDAVTVECIEDSLEGTEREATIDKLRSLPLRHLVVLAASTGWRGADGTIVQPVRTKRILDRLSQGEVPHRLQMGERAVQNYIRELETMGLVDTWMESHGRDGRAMYIETTFDPEWVREAQLEVAASLGVTDEG